MNKAERRYRTAKVINKRLNELRALNTSPEYLEWMREESHRMAKKHPLDCGITDCHICHSDKIQGGKPIGYRRKYSVAD